MAAADVALPIGAAAVTSVGSGQDDRLGALERVFEGDRRAFEDGVGLIEGLAAAAPERNGSAGAWRSSA